MHCYVNYTTHSTAHVMHANNKILMHTLHTGTVRRTHYDHLSGTKDFDYFTHEKTSHGMLTAHESCSQDTRYDCFYSTQHKRMALMAHMV